MKESILIGGVCLVLGGAGGYLMKGNAAGDDSKSNSQEVSSRISVRTSENGTSSDNYSKLESYQEIANQPGQTARIHALVDFYSNLSPDQFAEEAEKLDRLPFSERILAAYLLFGAWAEVSPTEALEHANTKMGFAGNFVKPTVLQSWAATDPSGAAQYYLENQSEFRMMGMMGGRRGRGGNSGAGVVAGEWAKQDPEGALQWASTLTGKDAQQANASVLKHMAKSDPAKAAGMLSSIDEGSRAEANKSIATEWGRKNWDETSQWIATLPVDEQDAAKSAAISSLSESDPERAANEVIKMGDGKDKDQAMENVAGKLAAEDPAGAMSWLMSNGSEGGIRDAVGDVIGPWVAQDRAGALSWVNEQPVGDVRDSAVRSYIFSDQNGPAEQSVTLAESMSEGRNRERTLGMAVYRWMDQDKEKATSYAESSEILSDRAKDRILGNR